MSGGFQNLGNVLLGDMATFNIQHGFPEAVVRGMRSGFLADTDYHHITQCENLEVRSTFQELTGYTNHVFVAFSCFLVVIIVAFFPIILFS